MKKAPIPDWLRGSEPTTVDWWVYGSVALIFVASVVLAALLGGCGPSGYEVGHAHSELCGGSTVTVGKGDATVDVPATLCVMVLTVESEEDGGTKTVGCTYVADSPVGTGYLPEPMSHERCTEAPGYRPFRVGIKLPTPEAAAIRPGYESSRGESEESGGGGAPAGQGGGGDPVDSLEPVDTE